MNTIDIPKVMEFDETGYAHTFEVAKSSSDAGYGQSYQMADLIIRRHTLRTPAAMSDGSHGSIRIRLGRSEMFYLYEAIADAFASEIAQGADKPSDTETTALRVALETMERNHHSTKDALRAALDALDAHLRGEAP